MRMSVIFAGLIFVGAGCAKTVNSVDINQNGSYNWIKTDPDLGGTATVKDVRKNRDNGFLHVQVVIENMNSNEGQFIYRFVWIDAGGMVVPTPLTNWQRQTIFGKQTLSIMGVAPDPRITDCRLEMKRPEN